MDDPNLIREVESWQRSRAAASRFQRNVYEYGAVTAGAVGVLLAIGAMFAIVFAAQINAAEIATLEAADRTLEAADRTRDAAVRTREAAVRTQRVADSTEQAAEATLEAANITEQAADSTEQAAEATLEAAEATLDAAVRTLEAAGRIAIDGAATQRAADILTQQAADITRKAAESLEAANATPEGLPIDDWFKWALWVLAMASAGGLGICIFLLFRAVRRRRGADLQADAHMINLVVLAPERFLPRYVTRLPGEEEEGE